MKRTLKFILAAEIIACLLVLLIGRSTENSLTLLAAFPWVQIGLALRFLSISGPMGNAVAIIIYLSLGLLPAGFLACRVYGKRAEAADGLLLLLSALLFIVLYLMVNPVYLARHFGVSGLLEVQEAFLGLVLYSLLTGYLLLRGMRILDRGVAGSVPQYLKILLAVIAVLLVYGICGPGLAGLLGSFEKLRQGNTFPGQSLGLSYLFLVLQYLVGILPAALGVVILFSSLEIIDFLREDPFGAAVFKAVLKTGRICRHSVAVILLSQIGTNLLQLALGSKVLASHYTLSIPLMPIVLMLVALLLANYFEKVKKLKEDHDMFI